MAADDLPCVRTIHIGACFSLAVALQDSVLIACADGRVLPVDIRAEKPADWRTGAAYIGDAKTGRLHAADSAYADGRLFVGDSARFVRVFDVVMHSAAAAAPIAKNGAPLVTLQPVSVIDSKPFPQ